ncbi:MAG TPA: hypothetical protein VLI55_16170 [Bryobacteraceae bacterium]|nr:hypothetical protein [Bryobacteraceae bacterium]
MPRFVQINALGVVVGIAAVYAFGAEARNKDAAHWTPNEVQKVLTASPWAQQVSAKFSLAADDEPPPAPPLPSGAQAGLAGPGNPPGVRWDGGVGRARGPDPTLNVLIRWDSALPVREALRRSEEESHEAGLAERAEKDYIVTIVGLVPAGRYRSVGTTESQSRSDDTIDSRNPETLLEGLMASSLLTPKDKPAIRPDDAKLDASTGTLHVFFPRTSGISLADKQVTFTTRFGSLTIQKQFRLKDMTYKGKLEL